MTPREVYCDRCGLYLKTVMAESKDEKLWGHTCPRLEDCVVELKRRLVELERISGG